MKQARGGRRLRLSSHVSVSGEEVGIGPGLCWGMPAAGCAGPIPIGGPLRVRVVSSWLFLVDMVTVLVLVRLIQAVQRHAIGAAAVPVRPTLLGEESFGQLILNNPQFILYFSMPDLKNTMLFNGFAHQPL